MPATTMVVSGTFLDAAGDSATGSVSFTPTATARFVNTGIIVALQTITAVLDGAGSISVTLVRCAAGYSVTENIDGSDPRTYPIVDGATANLNAY